jgi:DNA-directed RNA polymerase subunit RPC12/RpoP
MSTHPSPADPNQAAVVAAIRANSARFTTFHQIAYAADLSIHLLPPILRDLTDAGYIDRTPSGEYVAVYHLPGVALSESGYAQAEGVVIGGQLTAEELLDPPDDPDAREAEFLDLLDGHPHWSLFDSGMMETGLRCAHCGQRELFSDRDTAIGALRGDILCSACNFDPNAEPDGAPYFALTLEKGGSVCATPIVWYDQPMLDVVTASPATHSVHSNLLTTQDAATLYHMLETWLAQHAPELIASLDPMGDHMGRNA